MSAAELDRAVDLLVRQVGHWQQPRWSASAEGGNVSRADLVHKLVQELANLAADVEGGPRRDVPRLGNDLVLPDQLRVVAADLLAAGPPEAVLDRAAEAVSRTRSAL
ncbi:MULTISPECIES: hypothetical protein [Micromonospora]|jgi:hypothetical protein|uniref:Uncharacterized protein n=1 Tax=Micromonospora sicca TaxID=2202420 RepID=A0A317D473_9ACTN|nr:MULTISPECIES: hypothetical protein [unclassified Micromonospora]MBM0225723.1 hypothetical protein [Micromonospora sp. ATA51]MDZ5442032.1 hypothetical protein [Micromonospora sp. 4G57]MDZ5490541.1 hypothetical protein [Micromonospora sp. 4G53]PWR09142.1 hypothetical protein DKT69_31615 [Micromonospora sp. 4G51]